MVKRGGFLAVTATASIAILGAGISSASAQTLMDLLRGNSERRVQREAPPPPPVLEPAPAKRAAPARIRGPQYYTYKADALVRVDFAAIKPAQSAVRASLDGVVIDAQQVASTVAPATASAETVASGAIGPQQAAPVNTNPAAVSVALDRAKLTEAQLAGLQGVELLAEKEAAVAIVEHYSKSPELIWVADGRPNENAEAALAVLGSADTHGLDPRDYAVNRPHGSGVDALAAFEMELSARLLRYVRDAQNGRVDPNRISGYHDFKPKELDRAGVLQALSGSSDVSAYLEAQHPQNSQYKALRAELAALRVAQENDIVVELTGLLKPGQSNPEFPKILALIDRQADDAFRAAHGEVLAQNLNSQMYTQELVPVIKAAQKAAGLDDDGVIGPRTVQAIAGESRAGRIEKVEVALEQLRWLPSDLTDRYVFLNAPAFNAVYVEDGKEKLVMNTVVGTSGTQTYFFQEEISYVEFHPYWGMPRSILVNTYLARATNDPTYFERNGYEVTNQQGQLVSPSSINWAQYGTDVPYHVRQRPGPKNALGEMKIMFPNKHAIYMHDTPDRHLFNRDNRALSNGCVRLADPRAMAAAVLGWDRERVDTRLAGKHGRENLSVKVPVYVAYFTAWPDEAGTVHYHNDVYSRDEKVRAAIDKIETLRAPSV
jgi:murein L,D-transpeptidase YcbB/YkuD